MSDTDDTDSDGSIDDVQSDADIYSPVVSEGGGVQLADDPDPIDRPDLHGDVRLAAVPADNTTEPRLWSSFDHSWIIGRDTYTSTRHGYMAAQSMRRASLDGTTRMDMSNRNGRALRFGNNFGNPFVDEVIVLHPQEIRSSDVDFTIPADSLPQGGVPYQNVIDEVDCRVIEGQYSQRDGDWLHAYDIVGERNANYEVFARIEDASFEIEHNNLLMNLPDEAIVRTDGPSGWVTPDADRLVVETVHSIPTSDVPDMEEGVHAGEDLLSTDYA